MAATAQLKQVVGYVDAAIKEELQEMKSTNRRLSESALVEEALRIAMPELRQRHLPFKKPVQGASDRKKPVA